MSGPIESALILCRSDPSRDPRPRRMLEFCTERGIRTFVLSPPPYAQADDSNVQFIGQASPGLSRPLRRMLASPLLALPIPSALKLKLIDWVHGIRIRKVSEGDTWSRLIVHDLQLLPLALRLAKGAPVYFDAREFYPKQNEESWLFRHFEMPVRQWLCEHYIPQCRAMFTVSNGLRQCYRESFGAEATLLRSVPNFAELAPTPLAEGRIRLVHHGVANANRGLDQLIKMTRLLDDRFSLDLYLTGRSAAVSRLKQLASRFEKVTIHPPVPFEAIIPTLNAYDVGIAFYPPIALNLKYCLPNKFFEFIQARLAVVVGPSPDMAELIEEYAIGLVTDDFDFATLARQLNALDAAAISEAKARSHEAAQELCFEREKEKIAAVWSASESPSLTP